MRRLAEHEWRPLEAAHAARVDALTAGHLARRDRHERHPVIDFLFDYYGQTPGKLRRWHPGPGVALEGASRDPRAGWTHHRVDAGGAVSVDVDAFLDARGRAVDFIGTMLERTLERPIQTGCFGLHEWAMVYRQPQERRHTSWPLRLGDDGTNAVVDASTLSCSHFDATRFFTDEATPRNTLAPTRATQIDFEQPGCLHAGMDLYRWAFKLAPGMPSDLIADAFELALEIRTLDMQASPYDLSALGYDPVPIETPEGRREYAARQREFGVRGNALRRRLLEALSPLRATSASAS
jgi:hypothetical protein